MNTRTKLMLNKCFIKNKEQICEYSKLYPLAAIKKMNYKINNSNKSLKENNNDLLTLLLAILMGYYKTNDFDELMSVISKNGARLLSIVNDSLYLSYLLLTKLHRNQGINSLVFNDQEEHIIKAIYEEYQDEFLEGDDNHVKFNLGNNAKFDSHYKDLTGNKFFGRFNGQEFPIDGTSLRDNQVSPYIELRCKHNFVKQYNEMTSKELQNAYLNKNTSNNDILQFETIYSLNVNNELSYIGSSLQILRRLNYHFDYKQDYREHSKMFHNLMITKYGINKVMPVNVNINVWHIKNLFNNTIFKNNGALDLIRALISIHQDLLENLKLLETIYNAQTGNYISGGTLGANNCYFIK